MKKSLIALAVLAASGAAMAQSSVTLYGVADFAFIKSSNVGFQLGSTTALNNTSSRFGLMGTEDLGGGLKATFNYEAAVFGESGATAPVANGLPATFNRTASLGLSGGWGSLTVGRQLNPTWWGVFATDLAYSANYSAILQQLGYANLTSGVRNDSMVQYVTPNLSGFTGRLGYVFKADNAAAINNARVNASAFDAALIYAQGPLSAALTYAKTSGLDKNWSLAAKYNFGSFVAQAGYYDPSGARKGFSLAATVPVGGFALTANLVRDTNAKDTDLLLEGKYALSKRTFAYAIYYKDGGKAGSALMPGKNNFALGVRHNF